MIAEGCRIDPLNIEKKRTAHNTERDTFNCAGYALETYNWYCPYNDQYSGWLSLTYKEKLDKTVEFMLNDFKGNLRIIKSLKELKPDEYALAYRIEKTDFHFVKFNGAGFMYHKTGGVYNYFKMTKKEFESKEGWVNRYDSETILFAKKKIMVFEEDSIEEDVAV